MEDEAMPPALQVALHEPAGMNAGVITDHMNLAVAEQLTAQVIEVAHEQSGGAPLFGKPLGDNQRSRTPVERAGQVALLVGPGRRNLDLLPLPHPHRADL